MHGRDVDDPAEALLVHVRERRPGQAERGFKHHRDQQPEGVERELMDRRDMLQARTVHQDVGVVGQRVRVEVGGQVNLAGPSSDAGSQRAGRVQIDVGDQHVGPAPGQPGGTGRADAAGAAGDHGQPSGQILAHCGLLRNRAKLVI